MEWGTFITVIVAAYLVWFGFNFLFDLFLRGKSKTQTEPGVQYDVSDLVGDEEPARTISSQDYDQVPVSVIPPAETPESDGYNAGGAAQKTFAPALQPAAAAPETPASTPIEDWASIIDQEEEVVAIQVQGQPVSVTDFIQSFKNEAKVQAASIFN